MQPKAAKDTLGRRFYCAFMDYDRCVVRLFGSRRVAERAQITFAGSQESWTLARNRLVPVQQPWIHLGQVPADQPPLQLWPGGLEVQKFEETFLFLLGKKEINNKGISEKPDRRKKKKSFVECLGGRQDLSVPLLINKTVSCLHRYFAADIIYHASQSLSLGEGMWEGE